jgi:hypothetical protein
MAMTQMGTPPAKPTASNPITTVAMLHKAIQGALRRPPTPEWLAQIRDAAKNLKADQLSWVANFLSKHGGSTNK